MQKKLISWLVLVFSSGLIIYASVAFMKSRSPNQNDAKLQQARNELQEIPVPPYFELIGENTSSRHMDAGVYRYYRSNANLETVKEFYTRQLSDRNWHEDHAGENRLVFRKGDIYLYLDYRDKTADWNYGVSCVWRNEAGS